MLDLSHTKNNFKPDKTLHSISCNNETFKASVAKYFNHNPNQLSIHSCKEQSLFSLLLSLQSRYIYLYAPCDPLYEKVALKLGFSIEFINRFVDLTSEIIEDSIVIFANPSFPDGQLYDMDQLIEFWENSKATIIIDESYLKFSSQESAKKHISKNIFIIESLAPFYGIDELELVLVYANTKNINQLINKTPSCHISRQQQDLFLDITHDKSFKKISKSITIINKEFFIQELSHFSCIKDIIPSACNYFLILLKQDFVEIFQNTMKQNNIMVKTCEDYIFLDETYIQITLPKKSGIDKFLNILKEIEK